MRSQESIRKQVHTTNLKGMERLKKIIMTNNEQQATHSIAVAMYANSINFNAKVNAFMSGANFREKNPTKQVIAQILRCYTEGKSSDKDVETVYKALYEKF